MLKGQIITINKALYTVKTESEVYNCTARGKFRIDKISPLVGDFVNINEDTKQIISIEKRKNSLTRPNIANVDYALVFTSVKKPDLDLVLLDKLLVNIYANNIKPIICFSKIDLLEDNEKQFFQTIKDYYQKIGYLVITNDEIAEFEKIVSNHVVVICGQTGAGKSTFVNHLDAKLNLATSPISESLNRGKHTTRYVSLYQIKDYLIADTPGFSQLALDDLNPLMIRDSFIEFANYECLYRDCNHINTDGCEVIESVNKEILNSRYENYQKFIKEYNENSRKFFK